MPTPFETAVNLHQRRIYSFAHYFLASPQEAEDVTQEVLIRFWRHHDRLDESGVRYSRESGDSVEGLTVLVVD